ncbi:MAG: redoxin domain-containing protein [FCB group bacterium]|nr:redoxin domain-containing protein [FCB group bacterium]
MNLQIDDIAPDFSGEDQFGNTYRLNSFSGWRTVVIAFYPYDWSPICSLQMTEIQRDLDLYKNAGALIIAISADSAYSHKSWAEKHGFKFPLISDYDRMIASAYGVLNEKGFAERTVFIVGKDARIKYIRSCKTSERPSNESLLKILHELK